MIEAPKTCTICEDPRRDEFDRLARIENNIAKIAQNFALSYDSVYRHIKANHHIREITAIPTSAELATSEDVLNEITEHHKEAKRLKDLAETDGDIKTALMGLDKALKCLELIAKIQGQIKEQQIIINQQQTLSLMNPEWIYDPVTWIHDNSLLIDNLGNRVELDPIQQDLLRSHHKRIIINCHRQWGK